MVLATALGLVLLAAGLGKAVTRGSIRPFLVALGLPAAGVALVSAVVPVLEIGCGALLLAGVRPGPAWAGLGLAVVFLGVLWRARRAGIGVGCRCFGALDPAGATPVAVVRAAALAALAAVTVLAQRTSGPRALPVVLAGAAAAFVFVVGFALLGKVYEFEMARREARI